MIMDCGHDDSELRTRPSDGWVHCRLCKNEKERAQWAERMEDPAKRERHREKTNDGQKRRRQNPETREAVLQYDRERHMNNRDERLGRYRDYDQRRREDGSYYVSRYGVTLEDAQQALEIKPDGCEICGEGPVVFDHCDEESRFRGWLCRKHNMGLGYFDHDPDALIAAAEYLLRFKRKI